MKKQRATRKSKSVARTSNFATPTQEIVPDNEVELEPVTATANYTPPSVRRTATHLQKTGDNQTRRSEFLQLQRLYGNQYASKVARAVHPPIAKPPARQGLGANLQRFGKKKDKPKVVNNYVQAWLNPAMKELSSATVELNKTKVKFNTIYSPTGIANIRKAAHDTAFNSIIYPYVFGRLSDMLMSNVKKSFEKNKVKDKPTKQEIKDRRGVVKQKLGDRKQFVTGGNVQGKDGKDPKWGKIDAKKRRQAGMLDYDTARTEVTQAIGERRDEHTNQMGPITRSELYKQTAFKAKVDQTYEGTVGGTIDEKIIVNVSAKIFEEIAHDTVREYLKTNEPVILTKLSGTQRDLGSAIEDTLKTSVSALLNPMQQDLTSAQNKVGELEKSLYLEKVKDKDKTQVKDLANEIITFSKAAAEKAKVLDTQLVDSVQKVEGEVQKKATLQASEMQEMAFNEAFTFFGAKTWMQMAKTPYRTGYQAVKTAYKVGPKLEDNEGFKDQTEELVKKTLVNAKDPAKIKKFSGEAIQTIEKGELESSLKKVGDVINGMVNEDGARTVIDITLEVPVAPGAFVGFHLNGTMIKNLLKSEDGTDDKWRTIFDVELGITGGGQLPTTGTNLASAKLYGELGGYLHVETDRGGLGIANLISMALYNRFKNSKLIPSMLTNYIWGLEGKSAKPGESEQEAKARESQEWFGAMVEEMTDVDEVETGGYGALKTELKVGGIGIKGGLKGRYGTKISKVTKSEQEQKHQLEYQEELTNINDIDKELKKLDIAEQYDHLLKPSEEEKSKRAKEREKLNAKKQKLQQKVTKGPKQGIGQGAGSLTLDGQVSLGVLNGKAGIGLLFRNKKVDGFAIHVSARGMVGKNAIYGDPTEVATQILLWLVQLKDAIDNIADMFKERYYNKTNQQKLEHLAEFYKDYRTAKKITAAAENLVTGNFGNMQSSYVASPEGDLIGGTKKLIETGEKTVGETSSTFSSISGPMDVIGMPGKISGVAMGGLKEARELLLAKRSGVELAFDFVRKGGNTEAQINFNKVSSMNPGIPGYFKVRYEKSKRVIGLELAPNQKFFYNSQKDTKVSKYKEEMENWKK
jgi:hypothetical protein